MVNLITHLTPKTTSQELFDYITHFLMRQGQKSFKRNKKSTQPQLLGTCSYRGNGGLMCAVGCVIPDFFYKKNMEGESIDTLIDSGLEFLDKSKPEYEFWLALSNHQDLLEELQSIHDHNFERKSSSVRAEWYEEFENLAHKLNLEFRKELYVEYLKEQ